MCLSESHNMSANQNLRVVYTTRKSCPIVGELASSPWRVGRTNDSHNAHWLLHWRQSLTEQCFSIAELLVGIWSLNLS